MRLELPDESIPFENIVYIKANRMYSDIVLVTGRTVVNARPLSWYALDFLRPHKSVLVNPIHVAAFTGSHLRLTDGSLVKVAVRRLEEISKLFKAP